MDRSNVVEKVIEAVAQVQEASGRPAGNISLGTCPIKDVAGFDSLSGVEATVILCESLGCELPGEYNPFVSRDGRQALSISEIADNLREIIEGETRVK